MLRVMAKLGVGGLVMAVFFLGYLRPYILPNINALSFDAKRWKAWDKESSEGDGDLRWKMSSSLLEDQRLVGMERSRVVEFLGTPYIETEDEAHYYLGTTGLGVQAGVLIIYFDQESQVTNAVRVKH